MTDTEEEKKSGPENFIFEYANKVSSVAQKLKSDECEKNLDEMKELSTLVYENCLFYMPTEEMKKCDSVSGMIFLLKDQLNKALHSETDQEKITRFEETALAQAMYQRLDEHITDEFDFNKLFKLNPHGKDLYMSINKSLLDLGVGSDKVYPGKAVDELIYSHLDSAIKDEPDQFFFQAERNLLFSSEIEWIIDSHKFNL